MGLDAWHWGKAAWSARLFSTVLLVGLLIPAIATGTFVLIGMAPGWLLIPSALVLGWTLWVWLRLGVEWNGEALIVHNRFRTVKTVEADIIHFDVRRLDRVIPNLPQTIGVSYRASNGVRHVQIVATAVREGNFQIRRWYAVQFKAIGPGLDAVLQMRYAPQFRKTIFGHTSRKLAHPPDTTPNESQ